MVEIIPAILGEDFLAIKEKIDRLDNLTDWIHLDIADGLFVSDYTWNAPEDLKEINGRTKIEAHLMTEKPEEFLTEWLAVVDRLLIHYESTDYLEKILSLAANSSTEVGLVFLLNTPLESFGQWADRVKIVQLMSIKTLGHHGEPFDPRALERIKFLRARYPDVKISVDGGINLDTARACLAAGADRLVVGSALWNSPNLSVILKSFQNL